MDIIDLDPRIVSHPADPNLQRKDDSDLEPNSSHHLDRNPGQINDAASMNNEPRMSTPGNPSSIDPSPTATNRNRRTVSPAHRRNNLTKFAFIVIFFLIQTTMPAKEDFTRFYWYT